VIYAKLAPNQLQRQFQHDEPDQAWVTDITYIRTHEGWLYLAAVLDLHPRAVVGWSMSRRGNCWDNAVAESFFSNLKSEKIKKRIYQTRADAKSEIFDYIEGFYNRVRRHKHLDQISPLKFESRHQTAL